MTSNVIQPADIREVAVIGLGLMGSGIAELVARSGRRVVAIEINQTFLDQGMARLHASLDRAVTRGKLTDTAREEMLARIRPTDDIAAGVAGADLVIEAIPERMELKRTLFAQLDEACRADTILATNTSSLSITEIAGGTQYPARVAGLHFFNPAPVMKLVEVISTVLTAPETTETLALYHVRAPPWVARRAVGTILKFLARAADRIMVHSEAARSVLQNDYGVPAAKITITEFPGYPATPRADGAAPGAAAERPAAPSILYYGFLAPYKGVETLLAAYARARALAPDRPLRLVIAGTNHPRLAFDYAAVLRQEAVRVGAPDVSFPGYVDDRTSAALFSGSSLVVLPYLKTAGSSGTLASAMGANRPVVVTDLPTLIGQLNGYPNSRVVRPGDVAELAEVLLSVAEHQFVPRPPKALTTNAVRHWADLVDLTAEVYSSAIAARRPDFSDFATEFGGDTELPT